MSSHVTSVTPSFDSPQLPPVNVTDDPFEAAAGDFDADGDPDVVANTASFTTDKLTVLTGSGNGTFPLATSRTLPVAVANLAVGDFNADGLDDVATLGNDAGLAPNQLSILLGTPGGLGNALAPLTIPGSDFITGLAAGRLDGDGDLDLVTTFAHPSDPAERGALPLLGDGSGGFTVGNFQSPACASNESPVDLDLGDVTADAVVDAVIACQGHLAVLEGDGIGNLGAPGAPFSLPGITFPSEVHLGRFDGDGDLDALVADGDVSSRFVLGANDGAGAFTNSNPTDPGQPFSLATTTGAAEVLGFGLGDVNGDGHLDMVAAAKGSMTAAPHDVVIVLGNGNGDFGPGTGAAARGIPFDLNVVAFGNSMSPTDVALADFNLDHRLDIAALAAGHASGMDRVVSIRNRSVPSAMTGPTTGVGQTTAQVQGFVRPGGVPATYLFEYGTTMAYGSTTPLLAVPPSGGQTVAESIAGLQPGTTYHYRLRVENINGTWLGADRTFTTAISPAPGTPAAPTNVGRPALFGKRKQGRRLECRPGAWTGSPVFAYAWLRNGRQIFGARDDAYRLRKADVGRAIQCQVRASNAGGFATEESPPAVPKRAKKARQ